MIEGDVNLAPPPAWGALLEASLPSIHAVDRDATQIWWRFFPLVVADAIAEAQNPEQTARAMKLEGAPRLDDQIDRSHWFLYGHRYWPAVKSAILARIDARTSAGGESHEMANALIADVARRTGAEPSLVTGITLVGLMTLRQVGAARFSIEPHPAPAAIIDRTPAQIVAARAADDGQGWLGRFRGADRAQFSVRFDERRTDGRFALIAGQHLTTAAANDRRDYSQGPRPNLEGPIPVQCRSGSCGTCWIGVLGGVNKLSPVDSLEARRMREFGYITSSETHPIIRLACMSIARGNVTIAIPPWHGRFGDLTR